jgi:hypothetical protein
MQIDLTLRTCPECSQLFTPKNRNTFCGKRCSAIASRRKRSIPLAIRFWSKVDKSGEHWIWTGSLFAESGYGLFHINGKPVGAHRVAWELTNGPIPEGDVIRHTCDIKPCVRPFHLLNGTQKDNIHDAITRGRNPHGVTHGNAKLTPDLVRYIRANPDIPSREIAQQCGVSKTTILDVRSGSKWQSVA